MYTKRRLMKLEGFCYLMQFVESRGADTKKREIRVHEYNLTDSNDFKHTRKTGL